MRLKRLLRRMDFLYPSEFTKFLCLNSRIVSRDIYLRLQKESDPIVIRETRAHNGIEILPLQPICNHLMTFKGYLGFKNQNLCHLHTNYGF